MTAPWNGPTLEDAGREAGNLGTSGHAHAGHNPHNLVCQDCGEQSDFAGTYPKPCEPCPTCQDVKASGGFGPRHRGSKYCRSGSVASGGTRSHCTCDSCF